MRIGGHLHSVIDTECRKERCRWLNDVSNFQVDFRKKETEYELIIQV